MKIGSYNFDGLYVGSTEVNKAYLGSTVIYEKSTPYEEQYLTFEIISAGTIVWMASNTSIQKTISYSMNEGASWTDITSNTGSSAPSIDVEVGDKVLFKGTNSTYGDSSNRSYFSGSTAYFNIYGNIVSLIDGEINDHNTTTLSDDNNFRQLFGYTNVVDASNLVLPFMGLTERCYQDLFTRCSALTDASFTLPATTLAINCYRAMFYNDMNKVHSLVNPPIICATTMATSACTNMFYYNTSLTTAPTLPATVLANSCYYCMLRGCYSLTTAPALPATTLENNCYQAMFYDCTGLTSAPALPATTLASYCYDSMFWNCSGLTTAPNLSATTLANNCYNSMFRNCSSLSAITCLATDISATNCTANWVNGVAASGVFTKAASMTGWTIGISSIPNGWTVQNYIPEVTGITFSALTWVSDVPASGGTATSANTSFYIIGTDSGGSTYDVTSLATVSGSLVVPSTTAETREAVGTLTLTASYSGFTSSSSVTAYQKADIPIVYSATPLTFEIVSAGTIVWKCRGRISKTISYSLNEGASWTEITSSSASSAPSIDVSVGDTIMFKGTNTQYATGMSAYNHFTASTASFNVYGNIMSLIDGDSFTASTSSTTLSDTYTFCGLFGVSNVINASNLVLPATTLAQSCYYGMFSGCTSLTSAPALLATTMATSACTYMFRGCTGLTSAPALPATTLADYCYFNMFSGCTSLTSAPALLATTMATSACTYMFRNCSSLATAPTLPATTLALGCYAYMFAGCTGLLSAPDLSSATTLASGCCYNMFSGCTSLTTPTALPVTTLADRCYAYMYRGCSSLSSVPALPATACTINCYQYMFSGCTSLTSAPALPATVLNNYCYGYMFWGCTGLTSAPALPATTLADSCYQSMFYNCTSLSAITCLATDVSAYNCTLNWVNNVSATGTFTKASSMQDWTTGVDGIPDGWTVIDAT